MRLYSHLDFIPERDGAHTPENQEQNKAFLHFRHGRTSSVISGQKSAAGKNRRVNFIRRMNGTLSHYQNEIEGSNKKSQLCRHGLAN
jgi:hypothetical protein